METALKAKSNAELTAPLGLVAGGGRLPKLITEACQARGQACHVLVLEGQGELEDFPEETSQPLRLGAAADGFAFFRAAGVTQIAVCGYVRRPGIWAMRPTFRTFLAAVRMGLAHMTDGHLLTGLGKYIEGGGLSLLSVQDVLPEFVFSAAMEHGAPNEIQMRDLRLALSEALAVGQTDVAQGAVVNQGDVVAREDHAGTDALLRRCAELPNANGGVLVKAPKPQQDIRLDYPVIGAETVRLAAQAGLTGIGIPKGGALVLTPPEVRAALEESGLFLIGLDQDDIHI